VALARCARKGTPLTASNLSEYKSTSSLADSEIGPTLNEFSRRGVLSEADGVYKFALPIFERWLIQDGLANVQPDPVSEELAAIVQAEEDAAFVRSEELVQLSASWPTYQGRHVGADDIRSWYEQVDGHRDQRLLFKILTGTRVVGETEIRERLGLAFVQLKKQLSEFVRHSLADRRTDVLVTYLDGNGKSGEYYASLFAEQNRISVAQICPPDHLAGRLAESRSSGREIEAVIVIDDIAGTGGTLASNVERFVEAVGDSLRTGETKLLISTLYSTKTGSEVILKKLRSLSDVRVDFRPGEVLTEQAHAFSTNSKLWRNADERERAKALCVDLGSRIYKNHPLGIGGLALLLVFPNTVPNNTLPILHSASKSNTKKWSPLFRRPTN
jgi:hypothetical protein